jgi:hypothetical protein
VDAQKITHGFVRSSDGSFTSFDAPNQGGGLNPGTYALSINDSGSITGYVSDSLGMHGFLRSPSGDFTLFQVNPATVPLSINATGEITGYWQDNNGLDHAWVRATDGTITTFAGNDVDVSAISDCINAAGVTGGTISGSGFLRTADGTITYFLVNGNSPTVTSVNSANTVVGSFTPNELHQGFNHGFLRTE